MLGEKLKNLLQSQNMTQTELAEKLGITSNAVNYYVNDRRQIPQRQIINICKIFGVSADYFYDDIPPPPPNVGKIPEYTIYACCGNGIENWDNAPADYWQIPAKALPANGNLCIVTATGSSMAPTINDGDYLIIDRAVKTVNDDGIYLISINNNIMVKRVHIDYMTNSIDVRPDNPQYQPLVNIANDGEKIHVLGKVIRKITIDAP